MPEFIPQSQLDEYKNVSLAIGANLRDCTIAMIDIRDPIKKGFPVGSGVLVMIAGRLFVATAAHFVPRNPNGCLAFVRNGPERFADGVLDILSHGRQEGAYPDVAFLELPVESSVRLKKIPIGLNRISVRGVGEADRLAYLNGYPTAIINRDRKDVFDFKGMNYSAPPLPIDRWPDLSNIDANPVQSENDIFLTYDMDEELLHYDENAGDDSMTDPDGTSGGGIWQGHGERDTLWTPERMQLIGIQSGWNNKLKYIRASQIVHWLQLLYSSLPELRPIIAEHFPSVHFTTA